MQVCPDPNSFSITTAIAAMMEMAQTESSCSLDYIGIPGNASTTLVDINFKIYYFKAKVNIDTLTVHFCKA